MVFSSSVPAFDSHRRTMISVDGLSWLSSTNDDKSNDTDPHAQKPSSNWRTDFSSMNGDHPERRSISGSDSAIVEATTSSNVNKVTILEYLLKE